MSDNSSYNKSVSPLPPNERRCLLGGHKKAPCCVLYFCSLNLLTSYHSESH